jgi:hypothetical protein
VVSEGERRSPTTANILSRRLVGPQSTGKGVREHAASATNRTMRASNDLSADAAFVTNEPEPRPWHAVATLAITDFSATRHTRCASISGRWKRSRRGTDHPEGDSGGLSIRSAWTTKGGCGSASPLPSTNPYAAYMVTRDDHLVGIITLKDMMTLLALKIDVEGID